MWVSNSRQCPNLLALGLHTHSRTHYSGSQRNSQTDLLDALAHGSSLLQVHLSAMNAQGRSVGAASQRPSAPDLRQLLSSRELIGADAVLGEQRAEQRGRGRRRLWLRPARRVRCGRVPASAVADHRAGPAAAL